MKFIRKTFVLAVIALAAVACSRDARNSADSQVESDQPGVGAAPDPQSEDRIMQNDSMSRNDSVSRANKADSLNIH